MMHQTRILVVLSLILFAIVSYAGNLSEFVEVQVVDLQVTVIDDQDRYIRELSSEDFVVTEDGEKQEVIDLDLDRQPFSIGVLLDTSSSMETKSRIATRSIRDFISSLRKQDQYCLMTFNNEVLIWKDFDQSDGVAQAALKDLRFEKGTRFYEAMLSAVNHLRTAPQPRRALFLISDGVNTRGGSSLSEVIEQAQRAKILVYALIIKKSDSDVSGLFELVQSTGGSYFVLSRFPRLQAVYDKIAADLASRFTLYYRSSRPVTPNHRPVIQVEVKNPHWNVRYQKAYYFPEH